MPSPIGHAMAGLAVAWFADLLPSRYRLNRALKSEPFRTPIGGLAIACGILAAVPDADLLLRHCHRMWTHSIGFSIATGSVAAFIARRKRLPAVPVAVICGIASATHVLMDWLGKDTRPPYGIMALWPFTSRFYISGVDLFLELSRRYHLPHEFILGNLISVAAEIVVMAPILALAWWLRVRHLEQFREKAIGRGLTASLETRSETETRIGRRHR